jgi:hypothetical protein
LEGRDRIDEGAPPTIQPPEFVKPPYSEYPTPSGVSW